MAPMPPTSRADMDAALQALAARSVTLSQGSTNEQKHFAHLIKLLDRTIATVRDNAEDWVRVACEAKRIPFDAPVAGEEWLAGPVVTVRNLRLLKETLKRFRNDRYGLSSLTGRDSDFSWDGSSTEATVRTFPTSRFDALMFPGFEARTTMRSDAEVNEHPRRAYARNHATPGVSLVLGAGNVSSIPPMDALYKIIGHGKPCIVKMNPVNDELTPVFLKAFAPLIEDGLLRFVTGGADEGAYLTRHAAVTDVHVTGSNETHDSIVWGPPAPIRHWRKIQNTPILTKPITSELGNISPVMIVPGEYTDKELRSMAWNVCTQIVNNGSFNCNAAKMLVLASGWTQRQKFMDLLSSALGSVPPRYAYYPGAADRFRDLTSRGISVTVYPANGKVPDGALPWTMVYADANDRMNPLFTTEPFCAMVTITVLDASTPEAFLSEAVTFCNETLWGTLNACIMIDPRTEKAHVGDIDQAARQLRYGTVGINHWPALGYGFVSTPWGGHPSSTRADIKSGLGWVHNTYLLPDEMIVKTVIRGPLVVKPTPAWFANNRMTHIIGRKLVDFEASPSLLKLPGLMLAALCG